MRIGHRYSSVRLKLSVKLRALFISLRVSRNKNIVTERLGSIYGGWTVPVDMLDASSVVMSVGVGDDISFDQALSDRFGCTVHGFDPTPRSIQFIEELRPDNFVLHRFAISDVDGTARFFPPEKDHHISYSLVERTSERPAIEVTTLRLSSAIGLISDGRNVDLLKLDIEGAEVQVVEDMVRSGIRPKVLLIEFDARRLRQVSKTLRWIRIMGYRGICTEGLNASFLFERSR